MKLTSSLFLALGTVGLASLTMQPSASARSAAPGDIVDVAVSAGRFNVLAQALGAADLVAALQGDGPFTVFAPTDAAFAKLAPGTVEFLLQPENKQMLTDILLYHVVAGEQTAANVLAAGALETLNGQRIDVSQTASGAFVDGAKLWVTDIFATNGVIHVIDSVLLPSFDPILATADSAGIFGTLLAAVDAADLTAVLDGPGPFTVLAPTDDAFAKLPPALVASLLQPEGKQRLVQILSYHVIPGRVFSDQALALGSAVTLQGQSVTFSSDATGAFVNDAKLVMLDLDASNGVIHVIDTVLLPPAP